MSELPGFKTIISLSRNGKNVDYSPSRSFDYTIIGFGPTIRDSIVDAYAMLTYYSEQIFIPATKPPLVTDVIDFVVTPNARSTPAADDYARNNVTPGINTWFVASYLYQETVLSDLSTSTLTKTSTNIAMGKSYARLVAISDFFEGLTIDNLLELNGSITQNTHQV